MRKRIKYALIGTTVAAVITGGTLAAYADWPIPGTATVKVHTVKMPKGVKASVAKQSKAAVVSWSAQEIVAGVRMDRYTITAKSATKPDIVREVTASGGVSDTVTFAAGEVAGATWTWTLIPRFANWAGAESAPTKSLTFAAAPAAAPLTVPPLTVPTLTAPVPIDPVPPTPVPSDSAPTAESTGKPTAVPPPHVPEDEPTENVIAPPPATSPAEQKPSTSAPEPSASDSAP